jgi:hypothetical protein
MRCKRTKPSIPLMKPATGFARSYPKACSAPPVVPDSPTSWPDYSVACINPRMYPQANSRPLIV